MVYPYSFVRSQTSVPEANDIIRRYYYRFVSSMSRKEYRVFIDLCPNNIYIIPEDSIYLLVPNVLKGGKINVLARFMELKEHYGLVDYE